MIYKINTYKATNGKIPVKDFINDIRECPRCDAAKIQKELKLLSDFGFQRISDSKDLKPIKSVKGLYEMRVNDFRLFFSHCKEGVFVFYHIYKKTDGSNQKQDHEIGIAEKRMIEYLNSGKCK